VECLRWTGTYHVRKAHLWTRAAAGLALLDAWTHSKEAHSVELRAFDG
jgi:hypothetical protein